MKKKATYYESDRFIMDRIIYAYMFLIGKSMVGNCHFMQRVNILRYLGFTVEYTVDPDCCMRYLIEFAGIGLVFKGVDAMENGEVKQQYNQRHGL